MAKDPAPFDEGVFQMRFHKGKEHFDQNRLPAALEELEAAHHLRPQDEKVRNLLGMTYFKLDMLPQAEEMYIQLAASNPDIYTLHNNLGLIRLKLDKMDEADESLSRALQLQPSNPKTHFYLGLLCEKREQWEEGLRHFEAAQAEKMVSKMRARIEEERKKAEVFLPFEVLEVMEAPVPSPASKSGVAPHDALEESHALREEKAEIDQSAENKGDEEITNKMIRQQPLQEVRVQSPAVSAPKTEAEREADERTVAEEAGEKTASGAEQVDWQQFLRAPDALRLDEVLQSLRKEQESRPNESESLSDEAALQRQFGESEEPLPWEKTQPEIIPDEMEKDESVPEEVTEPHVDKSPTIPIEPPIFLAEGIEADISTFLAQSREEQEEQQEQKEDEFFSDTPFTQPRKTEFTAPESANFSDEEIEEEPFGNRIPTPEEVEHQVVQTFRAGETDSRIQDQSGKAEDSTPAEAATESPVHPEEEEEPEVLFSGWDEPAMDSEARDDTPMRMEPLEEIGEIEELQEDDVILHGDEEFFSLPDVESDMEEEESYDEESYDEEGHLEPSPLTPEVAEERAEMTQDMASALGPKEADIMYPEESSLPVDDHVPVQPTDVPGTEADADQKQTVEAEHESITVERSDSVAEASQEVRQAPEPAGTTLEKKVTLEPAKIDPFSRDRFYFQPLLGADRFLLMDPHLLEVVLSEDLICRIGTISSYTGNLQFSPWIRSSMNVPLVQVSGNGVLFMADQQKEIFLFSLNNEVLFVESDHLLVAQSALNVEPCVFKHPAVEERISVLKISGRGTLALTCRSKPLAMNVRESCPASIPAHAVIAWSGELKSEVQEDEQLQRIMGPSQNTLFLRFIGKGDIVVEQGSLWKDPRDRK